MSGRSIFTYFVHNGDKMPYKVYCSRSEVPVWVDWGGWGRIEMVAGEGRKLNNRIRHYRNMRGWTQKELARRIGTTAATISRLEMEQMTVSTDWLKEFADVFHVQIADLLDEPTRARIPMLGALESDGLLVPNAAPYDQSLTLEALAERPVAVRVSVDIGAYRAGDLLIGNRLEGADIINALGHDCLVALLDGTVLLRRVVKGTGDGYTLVPPESGDTVRYDETLDWAARLVMWVRRL